MLLGSDGGKLDDDVEVSLDKVLDEVSLRVPDPLVVQAPARVRDIETVDTLLRMREVVAEIDVERKRVGVVLGVPRPEGVAGWLCEFSDMRKAERSCEPVGEDDCDDEALGVLDSLGVLLIVGEAERLCDDEVIAVGPRLTV